MNLTDLMARAYASSTVVNNEILNAAAKEREEDAKRAAIQATKGLLVQFEQVMYFNVEKIRELRKQEKKQQYLISKLDRALRYFGESGNPLPVYKAQEMENSNDCIEFCRLVGIPFPTADDSAWNVPQYFIAGPLGASPPVN